MSGRALISTIYSPVGGVTTMVRAIAGFLREEGWEVRLGFYMPWSQAPDLSVRFPGMEADSPDWRIRPWEGNPDLDSYEIGARFPALEWQRYRLNGGWRRAIDDHDIHLVVSGNILPAAPIVEAGRPCLAWVATRYWPDKRDRLKSFAWWRRLFDLMVNTPVGLAMERWLTREVRVAALSDYTARAFSRVLGDREPVVLPMGVDTEVFNPGDGGLDRDRDRYRLGFVGRLGDPRKNVRHLVEALERLESAGKAADLHLVGGELPVDAQRAMHEAGLSDRVRVTGHMEPPELANYFRGLDVFVLPSRQEGLGIVGLEAMACGCPVVSTRCGGPEDYVEPGINGFLVGFDPGEMAEKTARILDDRDLHARLAEGALRTVRDSYSRDEMGRIFWDEFETTFGRTVRPDG